MIALLIALAALLVMILSLDPDQSEFSLPLFLISMGMHVVIIPAAIASVILLSKLLFRSWSQIQDGEARTSPTTAVGFLFIPYFNLYWMFVAFWGLSKDLDTYIMSRGIRPGRVNTGFVLAACITSCAMMLPLINIILLLVYLPLWLIAINEIKRASMAIAASSA